MRPAGAPFLLLLSVAIAGPPLLCGLPLLLLVLAG